LVGLLGGGCLFARRYQQQEEKGISEAWELVQLPRNARYGGLKINPTNKEDLGDTKKQIIA
jgi:hypothetical protein